MATGTVEERLLPLLAYSSCEQPMSPGTQMTHGKQLNGTSPSAGSVPELIWGSLQLQLIDKKLGKCLLACLA